MNLVCLTILGSDFDMNYNSDRYMNFHVRELDKGGGSQLIRISFPEFLVIEASLMIIDKQTLPPLI